MLQRSPQKSPQKLAQSLAQAPVRKVARTSTAKLRRLLAYLCLPLLYAPSASARSQAPAPIEIRFAAEVGGMPFDCTKTYMSLGTNKVDWQPQDLRFYVSDVRLLRADHSEVPVTLVADGTWQTKEVALLDFENRTGTCQNGTPQTNSKIRGTVPSTAGAVGLRFTMSVPFALNHGDASIQSPPLDQAGLFWGWQMGYKFLSLEGRVPGRGGHTVHIGSTGCTMPQPGQVTGCAAMNEAVVTLSNFDLQTQTVVADVARLLANSAIGPADPEEGPTDATRKRTSANAGCMSEHDNPQCKPIFRRLGLPFAGAAADVQQFFYAR